jgi:2-polyprenyl-6-methoxyphenol hydroxylase-like FAD-dependent oxidoreductase
MKNQEVIIVGAGTVGLITALGLARARVKVRVLEAALTATNETRDMVYQWSVLPGLARLGVLGDCLSVGMQTRRWAYYPAIGEPITFGLAVAADQLAYPFNMHLGQGDMTQILLRALASAERRCGMGDARRPCVTGQRRRQHNRREHRRREHVPLQLAGRRRPFVQCRPPRARPSPCGDDLA